MASYMKRLAMPRTWPLARKGTIYVAKPLPGRELQRSLPLSIAIKHLEFARTTREVKFILNSSRVKVNLRPVKEVNYPIGLFDVISFPTTKKSYRLLFKNKKLFLHPISEAESKIRPARVVNKTILKGKKMQVNLGDGSNFLASAATFLTGCRAGDTIIIDLEKNLASSTLKLEKNSLVYMMGGKHLGHLAKVLEIEGERAICEIEGSKVNALRKHLFVIGKEKPVISLPQQGAKH